MRGKIARPSDRGWTALPGGGRVRKDHPRVAACGDLDELNCLLGAARAAMVRTPRLRRTGSCLRRAQEALLCAGACLASESPSREQVARLAAATRLLERSIELLGAGLTPRRCFTLPGGTRTGVWLHLARAVCRRAERAAVALGGRAAQETLPFLNRLSAFLFIAARWSDEGSVGGRPRCYNGRREKSG